MNLTLVLGKLPTGIFHFCRPKNDHPILSGVLSAANMKVQEIVDTNTKGYRMLQNGKYLVPTETLFGVDTLGGILYDWRIPAGEYKESLGICEFGSGRLSRGEEWIEKIQNAWLIVKIDSNLSMEFRVETVEPDLPDIPWKQIKEQSLEEQIQKAEEMSDKTPIVIGSIGLFLFLLGGWLLYYTSTIEPKIPAGVPAQFLQHLQADNNFIVSTIGIVTESIKSVPGLYVTYAEFQKTPSGGKLTISFSNTELTMEQKQNIADAIASAVESSFPEVNAKGIVAKEINGILVEFNLPERIRTIYEGEIE